MSILLLYLVKLAVCLVLGFLFYATMLRRTTWYQWNRYFLLLFPLFAMAAPLVPLSFTGKMQAVAASFHIVTLHDAISPAQTVAHSVAFNWMQFATAIVVAGMAFFSARFLVRLVSLFRTRVKASLVNSGDIRLYHLAGCKAPFSFGMGIYLDTSLYEQDDLEKIVAHESVHIEQRHTLDTIAAEVLCIVQWFNPFAWLLKQATRQNLEFIADDAVLNLGANRKSYQYLLLKVSGAMNYPLATSFLFPSLKNRIRMMNSERSPRRTLLRFVYILPLICVLLFAFSGPAKMPPPDAYSLGSLSFYINDAQVAELLKKEQVNSYLHAGGPLSLALMSEEKARIRALLEKHGYDNLNSHSITFLMDTSAASHSFSVQVTIRLDKSNRHPAQLDESARGLYSGELAGARDTQYIVAPEERQIAAASSPPAQGGSETPQLTRR